MTIKNMQQIIDNLELILCSQSWTYTANDKYIEVIIEGNKTLEIPVDLLRNKKRIIKMLEKVEQYKEGILKDIIEIDRDISAIVCGYGYTFVEDYILFKFIVESRKWYYFIEKEGH